MLEFLDRQVDKIVLMIMISVFVFAAGWMIHYNILDKWPDKAWDAALLVLGAFLREVSGPVSGLVKSAINSINGKNGGNNVSTEKK